MTADKMPTENDYRKMPNVQMTAEKMIEDKMIVG